MTVTFSEPLEVSDPSECAWYHTFEFPDGRLVRGRWDYRGKEDDFLGRLDYDGKRAVEFGPASGALTRAMEQRGADVTCFDTSLDAPWNVVPRLDVDSTAFGKDRERNITRLWRSWWLSRQAFGGTARVAYAGAEALADLDPDERFDIGLIGCILQHFESPYRMLSIMASRCDAVVVTEPIVKRSENERVPTAVFGPDHDRNDIADTWWYLGTGLVTQMMKTLAFTLEDDYRTVYRRWDLHTSDEATDTYVDREFYTHVYRRDPKLLKNRAANAGNPRPKERPIMQ